MAMKQLAPGIYERGPHQFFVRIRRNGQSISRTFETYEDARRFRDVTVGKISGHEYVDKTRERKDTLRVLLERYLEEVTPSKKGARQEENRLRHWLREPLADWPVASIQPNDIAEWRNKQIAAGKAPTTVSNPLNLLSAVFKMAITEWGYKINNPCLGLKRPKSRPPREAFLEADEEIRLIDHCRNGPWYLEWAVKIALETAMRQGEIRKLRWEHVAEYTVTIPESKNGSARTVPLTSEAEEAFKELRQVRPHRLDGWIFGDPELPAEEGGFTEHMIQQAYRDAAKSAGISLTFHDLRHVAITRLAPIHKDPLELAKTTGHKTLAVLMRYYNPSMVDRAKEMRKRKLELLRR